MHRSPPVAVAAGLQTLNSARCKCVVSVLYGTLVEAAAQEVKMKPFLKGPELLRHSRGKFPRLQPVFRTTTYYY